MWNVRASASFMLSDQGPFQFEGKVINETETKIWQASDKGENKTKTLEMVISGPLKNPRLNFGEIQPGLCS